jgi:hypothetical protein
VTIVERELQERSELFVCFVDIRKAFPRVRRELLWERMLQAGCPEYLVRAVMAIYDCTKATARTPVGFSPTFLIQQGTREGCILSPILFLIFFFEAVKFMGEVELADGQVHLGVMVAVILLFADDVALIARSIEDLQRLLDAWGHFCDISHEQVAVAKTKAMCFRTGSSTMRLLEGRLFRRVRYDARSSEAIVAPRGLRRAGGDPLFALEPLRLAYRGGMVDWVSLFKYLGSMLADTDFTRMPMTCALANARKAEGIVKSVAGSTVVMPVQRLLQMQQSLGTSLATVNAVAWAPRVYQSKDWRRGEASFYSWLLGSARGHVENFRWHWDVLFDTPSWSAIVLQAIAKLFWQMSTSPAASFLGGLRDELWTLGRACAKSWMCESLRWWAWCFNLRTRGSRVRWMEEARTHMLELAELSSCQLRTVLRRAVGERTRAEAVGRMSRVQISYTSYDFVLQILLAGGVSFGVLSRFRCTRFALRSMLSICYGGLPLARTRCNYQYTDQLAQAGVVGELRRACLFCLVLKRVCVLESEWHFLYFCPQFTGYRFGFLDRGEAFSDTEFSDTFSPAALLCGVLSDCAVNPMMAQRLCSFMRSSLQVRDKWLVETVGGGLFGAPMVQLSAILDSARGHSSSPLFSRGVAAIV